MNENDERSLAWLMENETDFIIDIDVMLK